LRLTKTTTTKTGTTSKENNMTPKKTIQVRDLKPMKDAKGGAVANVMSNHGAASHGAASHGAASHGAASHKHAQHATRGLN
jgi:hypothetical protein